MFDRESAAVNSISDDFDKSNKLILLVYGDAHNFNKAVENHNKKNHNKKLGLIKLTPKAKQIAE